MPPTKPNPPHLAWRFEEAVPPKLNGLLPLFDFCAWMISSFFDGPLWHGTRDALFNSERLTLCKALSENLIRFNNVLCIRGSNVSDGFRNVFWTIKHISTNEQPEDVYRQTKWDVMRVLPPQVLYNFLVAAEEDPKSPEQKEKLADLTDRLRSREVRGTAGCYPLRLGLH